MIAAGKKLIKAMIPFAMPVVASLKHRSCGRKMGHRTLERYCSFTLSSPDAQFPSVCENDHD